MADIYLESMSQNNQCINNLIGYGIAAMLNSDPIPMVNYLQGSLTTLPYPYSCIQSMLDFATNILGQALGSFNSGTPLNLTIPSIPSFS